MKYTYVVLDIPASELEHALASAGENEMELRFIIPLANVTTGILLNGRPKIELVFKCIFIKPEPVAFPPFLTTKRKK
jgi:hypothetical protein